MEEKKYCLQEVGTRILPERLFKRKYEKYVSRSSGFTFLRGVSDKSPWLVLQ